MPFVITSVEEFTTLFPGVAHVYDGQRFECFANGAQWDHETRSGYDAPSDQHELDKRLVEYHAAVVHQAQARFDRCDHWVRQSLEFARMNAGPIPPDSAIADRRKFKIDLIKAQTALEQARSKLQLSPAAIARREYQAQRSAHAARAAQLLSELNGD